MVIPMHSEVTEAPSWLEHRSVDQNVRVRFPIGAHDWIADSVLGWGACKRQPNHRCFSLALMFLSLPSHLSKVNEHFLR